MRRSGLAAVVVACACAGACGAASASPAAPCGPTAAKTLAVDRQARVYSTGASVYGCATTGAHSYLLGKASARPGQGRVGKLALAGEVVAYAITQMGVDTASTSVIVRRLDNGETLHALSATSEPLGPEFFQTVEAIVVKPNGAVAWIGEGGSIVHSSHQVELLRVDRRGEATLDRGSGIYPPSLRLSGSRLTWRDHGTLRSATLI